MPHPANQSLGGDVGSLKPPRIEDKLLSAALQSNFPVNSAGAWLTVLTLTLSAGTWEAYAQAQLLVGGTADTFAIRLTIDGSTSLGASEVNGNSAGSAADFPLSLNNVVVVVPPGGATLSLQVRAVAQTTGIVEASTPTIAGAAATRLTASKTL